MAARRFPSTDSRSMAALSAASALSCFWAERTERITMRPAVRFTNFLCRRFIETSYRSDCRRARSRSYFSHVEIGSSLAAPEAVADTTHSVDQPRLVRLHLDFLAQVQNVRVDDTVA